MKLNNKGFTCWPSTTCRPVEVLDYDGNKRCRVRMSESDFEAVDRECKAIGYELSVAGKHNSFIMRIGYVSRTPYDHNYEGFKPLRRVDRHVLSWNSRQSFKPVVRKTTWYLYPDDAAPARGGRMPLELSTVKDAIREGFKILRRLGQDSLTIDATFTQTNNRGYSSSGAHRSVVLYADGTVIQYAGRKGHNLARTSGSNDPVERGTYRRGFGSSKNVPYSPRRVWHGGRRRKMWFTVGKAY